MVSKLKQKCNIFRQEHGDLLKLMGRFLILGSGYCVFTLITGIGIPCIFHKITGLSCPGCGISRFFLCLVQLDFSGAVSQNLAVAILLPFWLIIGLIEFFINPAWLSKGGVWVQSFTIGSCVLLILFGILRNLPRFSFLLPT